MAVKGVLLDIDGALIKSNDAHAEAFVQVFSEFGHTVAFEEVRSLIGMGGDKIFPHFVPGLDHQEGQGKQMSERRTEIFLEKLPELIPTSGAHELLERMKDDGLLLIAASSSKSDELEQLLIAAGIEDLIDEQTTANDAEQSKPAGDIIKAALDKGGFQPDEVVLIGDTAYDIEAGQNAGVATIALRCGGSDDEDLAGAVAIYDDPADLLLRYGQSPLKQAPNQTGA